MDLTASHDKQLDFEAESGDSHAQMGQTLHTSPGAPIRVRIHTVACAGSLVHLILDGKETDAAPPTPVNSANAPVDAALSVAAGRHWLRVEVQDINGHLQLMSSPLYMNFSD